MKDKIKKIIILLSIIVVICIILLLILSRRNDLETADYSKDSEGIDDLIEIQVDTTMAYEKNKNIYYTIVSIVNKYIDAVSIDDKDALLNMLDSQYIANNNITTDNINEVIEISSLENDFQYYVFVPDTIYSVDEGKITTHFVYGTYYNIADMNKKEIDLMIELDTVNQTFNIYNHKYIVDNNYNNLKIGDSYNAKIDEIENRDDNTFTYITMSDEEMASKYLDDFKEIVLYDKDKAFQMLDEEYSKLKFKNQEDFNKFVENKKVEFFKADLSEYTIKINELGNKVYICKDKNDNYYYFEETDGIMRYKVMLDNYILDDDFESKYATAEEKVKVALNIEKFIQAINDKSYYYAYNCLADSFKNNYFKTQEEFETYVKTNFYESNSITYNSFEIEGELYTYSVTITNIETNEQKNKTFIMQLGEGTEFVLSFDR